MFFGTYTINTDSKGVYRASFNPDTGILSDPEPVAEATNPTFLAFHPSKPVLYAVDTDHACSDSRQGAVSAFAVAPQTGKLEFLGQFPTNSMTPCHITVSSAGNYLLFTSYHDRYVGVLLLDANGIPAGRPSLIQHEGAGPNAERQTTAHPHSVNLSPDQRFAFVADLGIDQIMIYRFDEKTGELTPNNPCSTAVHPGAGPRHIAFHPDGTLLCLINELDSTIMIFEYKRDSGNMTLTQTVPALPPDFTGENTTAEIAVHPGGRLVYGSNRGHDSLVCYAMDPADGKLSKPVWTSTLGKGPRHFAIHSGGRFLLAANQMTGTVVVMRLDPLTGALEYTGQTVNIPGVVCVRFMA